MSFPQMSGSVRKREWSSAAREQLSAAGPEQPAAPRPRSPRAPNPGTEESPRTCYTCCCCLRAPSRRPASRTPRPLNRGAAPRCYWRSRSSGRRPERWRWPGPGGEPPEQVGQGTSAWVLPIPDMTPPSPPQPSAPSCRVHAPNQASPHPPNLANSFRVPSSLGSRQVKFRKEERGLHKL